MSSNGQRTSNGKKTSGRAHSSGIKNTNALRHLPQDNWATKERYATVDSASVWCSYGQWSVLWKEREEAKLWHLARNSTGRKQSDFTETRDVHLILACVFPLKGIGGVLSSSAPMKSHPDAISIRIKVVWWSEGVKSLYLPTVGGIWLHPASNLRGGVSSLIIQPQFHWSSNKGRESLKESLLHCSLSRYRVGNGLIRTLLIAL